MRRQLIGGVYALVNKTGEVRYVGETCDLPARKQQHLKSLAAGVSHNIYLQRVWNSGEKLKFKTLVFGLDTTEERNSAEMFYEHWFRTAGHRLCNIRHCGGSKGRHSKETRKKLSDALRGNTARRGCILSEETKKRISEAKRGHKDCVGRKFSVETKQKMSSNRRGRQLSDETKAKYSKGAVLCVETGRVYVSASTAAREYGWPGGGSGIRACVEGKAKSAGGLHWKAALDDK